MHFLTVRVHFNVILILTCFACSTREDSELDRINSRADSLMKVLNDPALKAANEAILADASDPSLYQKRALVYLGLKKPEEAMNDIRRAIHIDSTDASFWLTLADIYYSQNNTKSAKEVLETTELKFPSNTESLLK